MFHFYEYCVLERTASEKQHEKSAYCGGESLLFDIYLLQSLIICIFGKFFFEHFMYKVLVFISTILFAMHSMVQANERKMAEYIVHNNDSVFRHQIIYNSKLEKVLQTKFIKNASQWQALTQMEWNTLDNKHLQILRKRVGNVWKNDTEIETKFENTQKTEELAWEYVNDAKQLRNKKLWVYNINNNIETYSEYSVLNNTETLSKKTVYAYDVAGNLTHTDEWVYGEKAMRYRTSYFYENEKLTKTILSSEKTAYSNEFKDEIVTQYFYTKGSDKLWSQRTRVYSDIWGWQNKQMLQYIYTDEKISEEIFYDWISNAWAEQMRYTISYDSNNNIEKKQLQLPIYKKWRNVINQNYTWDSNTHLTINSTFDFWGEAPNAPACTFVIFDFNGHTETVMANKLEMKFGLIDEITSAQIEKLNANIRVYPNPSDAIFYIESKDFIINEWQIKNLSGLTLKSNNTQYTQMVDLSEFPSGVYMLVLNVDNHSIVRKLVKH